MTNTEGFQSPIPTTLTGVTCGLCSHGSGPNRVQVKHATAKLVGECYMASRAPKVAAPAPVEQLVIEVPAPVEAPAPTMFGRYAAACPKKGCQTKAVKDHPFTLKCTNHGKFSVRTRAKQLKGTLSTSTKHKCDPRCTGAVGAVCVCQCGGKNHGVDHLNIAMQPA